MAELIAIIVLFIAAAALLVPGGQGTEGSLHYRGRMTLEVTGIEAFRARMVPEDCCAEMESVRWRV